MAIGIDIGSYNIIKCVRNKETKAIEYTKEVNAFVEISMENKFQVNLLKQSGVPIAVYDKSAYILGEAAVNTAMSINLPLKRPMKDGCVDSRELKSFQILNIMLHSLIRNLEKDGEIICYCIPANAINRDTDADYHQKIIEMILSKFENSGKRAKSFAINEGLALIYSELGSQQYTGAGISFGSGMKNFCLANTSIPTVQFSLVDGGDWIDRQVAKATGESEVFVNKEKEKLDLTKPPDSIFTRALITQYQILIEKTVKDIHKRLSEAGNKVRFHKPIDFILAGGVVIPNGFEKLFSEAMETVDWPFEIGEVKKAAEPLFAVSRGTLIAAEMSE